MFLGREGRTVAWRWFSREQWGRLHSGDQKDRMIAVWDDLAIWVSPNDRRDNNGTVELLLSHEVLVSRSGASENDSVE
jgi:hypothetical protein